MRREPPEVSSIARAGKNKRPRTTDESRVGISLSSARRCAVPRLRPRNGKLRKRGRGGFAARGGASRSIRGRIRAREARRAPRERSARRTRDRRGRDRSAPVAFRFRIPLGRGKERALRREASLRTRVANPNRVAPERARGARAGTMQPGIAPGASERRPDTTSRGKIGRDTASWDVREGRTCTTSRPPAQHDATASSVGMQNKLVSSPLPPRVWLGQGAKYDARIMGGTHASSAGKPAASCAGTEGGRGGVEGSARGVGEGVGFDRKARCRSRTRSTR